MQSGCLNRRRLSYWKHMHVYSRAAVLDTRHVVVNNSTARRCCLRRTRARSCASGLRIVPITIASVRVCMSSSRRHAIEMICTHSAKQCVQLRTQLHLDLRVASRESKHPVARHAQLVNSAEFQHRLGSRMDRKHRQHFCLRADGNDEA
jgi:hypothetical protein